MPFLFFIFFVILNGKVTLEICIFGAVIAAVMSLFAWKFLGYDFVKEVKGYRFVPMYLVYAGIVVKEIFLANFQVIGLIFDFKYKPKPVLVSFKTSLKSEYARVALANSITLTPGTISVELDGDRYVVHCLDERFVCDFNETSFSRYLMKIEGKMGKTKEKKAVV